MKKYFVTTIVLLFSFVMYGQITTEEKPVSFKINIPDLSKNDKTQKSMPFLNMELIEKEDAEDESNGRPPRFGYPHEVNYTLDNSGEWADLPDGGRIWRLSIFCPNALSVNLLFDKFWIPDGAKFFVYSIDRKQSIGAVTSPNTFSTKDDIQGFATGLVYGDRTILEYYLPKGVKDVGVISVAFVVHGYRYIQLPEEYSKDYGNSGGCHVNVNCSDGQNWQDEKNAVAVMLINGIRWCTGSLINTTANDHRPLFLTANHCLISYDAESDSTTNLTWFTFYWDYESPGCTSLSDPTGSTTTGAKIVANNKISDFALLRLSQDPLEKALTPYYLGWDRSGSAGTGGVGIHHPNGDIKKISTYGITPSSTYYEFIPVYVNGDHWRVTWSAGVTEKGSSGSPLINNNKKIIGQLHGGLSYCIDSLKYGPNESDWYGKFSVSWTGNAPPASQDPKYWRRLNYWLDPLGTNPATLNGRYACPLTTPVIDGVPYFTLSQMGKYKLNPTGGSSVIWTVTPTTGVSLTGMGDSCIITPCCAPDRYYGTYQLKAKITYSNGCVLEVFKGFSILDYSPAPPPAPAQVYPNPVGDMLTVDPDAIIPVNQRRSASCEIRLADMHGNLKRQATGNYGGKIQIDVSGLSNGIYFLHIYNGVGNSLVTYKIVVRH